MAALEPLNHLESETISRSPALVPAMNEIAVSQTVDRIAGATIRLSRFKPEALNDEVRVLINGGYCAPAEAYFSFALGLAQTGRDVTLVHSPRIQSPRQALRPDNIRDVLRLQSQANWSVLRDVEYADIVAHSMGLVIALRSAREKHEHIRSVSAAGGAGLDGPHGITKMLLRSISSGPDFEARSCGLVYKTAQHVLQDPVRTIREGLSVARIDVRSDLEAAKNHGIKIGAFLFGNDKLFSPQDVLEHSEPYFDQYDIVPEATHNFPIRHPFDHAPQQAAALSRLNGTISQVVA
jgi:hypothetical protein